MSNKKQNNDFFRFMSEEDKERYFKYYTNRKNTITDEEGHIIPFAFMTKSKNPHADKLFSECAYIDYRIQRDIGEDLLRMMEGTQFMDLPALWDIPFPEPEGIFVYLREWTERDRQALVAQGMPREQAEALVDHEKGFIRFFADIVFDPKNAKVMEKIADLIFDQKSCNKRKR